MIWADRIGIVWLGVVLLAVASFGAKWHLEEMLNADTFRGVLFIVGAPWLLLRGIDFIATGCIRSR